MWPSLVVFLPLLAAAIAGFFGRAIGDRGAQIVTCGALLAVDGARHPAVPRRSSARTAPQVVPLATWIAAGGVDVDWSLRLDTLSGVMILVVTIVSAMVHVYSIGYMAHDPRIPRFMAYLSLFTFFMLMLVTANDFVQLFFGWEGVGLVLLPADRLLVRPRHRPTPRRSRRSSSTGSAISASRSASSRSS